MSKLIDLTGQAFGKLTVLNYSGKNDKRQSLWECICECGNRSIVEGSNLKKGNTKSCGCLSKERVRNINLSHQLSSEKLYRLWIGIKTRCNNNKTDSYNRYGGRGIKVCTEWNNDFKNFYDWAIKNGYSKKLTLDRIDNNGNYEPSNCRWVNMKEQSNNTRKNRWITYNGETKTLAQWCEYLNLNKNMVSARLHRGWTIEKTFETPVNKK